MAREIQACRQCEAFPLVRQPARSHWLEGCLGQHHATIEAVLVEVEFIASLCTKTRGLVESRKLLVFRDPSPTGYLSKQSLAETDSVSPLAAPASTIRVADLLP